MNRLSKLCTLILCGLSTFSITPQIKDIHVSDHAQITANSMNMIENSMRKALQSLSGEYYE